MTDLAFVTREVRFTVDGKKYVGLFSFKAQNHLAATWGLANLGELESRLNLLQGGDDVLTVFHASLISHQPDLTVEDAAQLAESIGISGLGEYLRHVMAAAKAPASAVGKRPTTGQAPPKKRR